MLWTVGVKWVTKQPISIPLKSQIPIPQLYRTEIIPIAMKARDPIAPGIAMMDVQSKIGSSPKSCTQPTKLLLSREVTGSITMGSEGGAPGQKPAPAPRYPISAPNPALWQPNRTIYFRWLLKKPLEINHHWGINSLAGTQEGGELRGPFASCSVQDVFHAETVASGFGRLLAEEIVRELAAGFVADSAYERHRTLRDGEGHLQQGVDGALGRGRKLSYLCARHVWAQQHCQEERKQEGEGDRHAVLIVGEDVGGKYKGVGEDDLSMTGGCVGLNTLLGFS